MTQTIVGLYREHSSDLPNELRKANENGYDLIATNIVNPIYRREYINEPMKSRHLIFSRSDLILESSNWLYKIISKINDRIDCDSEDEHLRKYSEQTLQQELAFADHLVQHGFLMIRLKSGKNINLAKIISRNIKGTVLIQVPMENPKIAREIYRKPSKNSNQSIEAEDTWQWWNRFRTISDFHPKIAVALELSADIPSVDEIERWLSEPVLCLIIPSSIFIRNAQNYPVLSKAHQSIIAAFIRNHITFLIKCAPGEGSLKHYADYIRHLGALTLNTKDPMEGYDDVLEIPLQPLYDNLDSYTYEVFEKDPIKYLYYQKAIEQALIDKVLIDKIETTTITIMVVGAGRGPIVRAALNAAENTKRKCRIYIIEKNPNAVITLTALCEELWADKDIKLISCDMRYFTPPEKIDILVSELLGSFGDNELSPECLDGVQKHLKDDGISIPMKSTSYINPVMTPRLYELVRTAIETTNPRDQIKPYSSNSENGYVVYMKRAYHIDSPQPLFEFIHPNRSKMIDNTRFKTLCFTAKIDCILTGFAGYFDSILYKDINISIHPETHSVGLASWFSMYFPISEPIQVKAGNKIEVNFWRCLSSHKVWYEWSITSPTITHIHNHGGRHCPIYK